MGKNTPRIAVGIYVLLVAAALMVALFLLELPEGNREIALVAFGIVLGWGSAVVQFHFGSSEGSKQKTEMMADEEPSAPDVPEEDIT